MSAGLAVVVAGILSLLAAIHVYWAFGGRWPGADDESLALAVVGGAAGMRMPGPTACLVVAVLLAVAAGLVAGAARAIELPLPPALVRLGAFGVAAAFLLRGAFGFIESRVRPVIRGSRYASLNVWVYSPLCIVVGATTLASMRLG